MPRLTLPDDILYRILQYLPAGTLQSLVSEEEINHGGYSVFVEQVLKSLYGTVEFNASGDEIKRICAKLGEKKVNAVVHSLIIKPWLVQPRTNSALSFTENAWNRLNQAIDPDYLKNQAEMRVQKRLRKDIKRITAAVSDLKRLRTYMIDWDGRSSYHPELYKAFLSPLLGRLVDQVVKLTLHVPLEMLGSLTCLTLPKLQELDLRLCTGSLVTSKINHILDAFLVFVNNLKDNLQRISVSSLASSEHLDLAYFFKYLGIFPNLRAVAISIPFDGAHLPSTDTFSQFLRMHASSLEHLKLSTTRCAATQEPYDPKRSEQKYWIQKIGQALIQKPLPQLRAVEIALRPLKADFSVLFEFLRLHASSLASLTLTDRVLEIEEVEPILDALALANLRYLQFRVHPLSPDLFRLLASKFPGLSSLGLSFSEVASSKEEMPQGHHDCVNLEHFCKQMISHKQQFRAWELRTLALSHHMNPASVGRLEKALVESIPALKTIAEF